MNALPLYLSSVPYLITYVCSFPTRVAVDDGVRMRTNIYTCGADDDVRMTTDTYTCGADDAVGCGLR